MAKSPTKLVSCPQCGKKSPWNPDNRWRPFCSERCKTIDLAAWANESYRVPQQEADPGTDSVASLEPSSVDHDESDGNTG